MTKRTAFAILLLTLARPTYASAPEGSSCQSLLMMIDLGLSHLGTEIPTLVANLEEAGQSAVPKNPFLNLSSPLGRAMASRAESTIANLQSEWPSVQERIQRRNLEQQKNAAAKQIDQEATKVVVALREISFEQLEPGVLVPWKFKGDLGEFKYLGQTELHHVVAAGPSFMGKEHELGSGAESVWRAFLISRYDGKIIQISRYYLSSRNQSLMMWVRDGVVFGISPQSVLYRLTPQGDIDQSLGSKTTIQNALDAPLVLSNTRQVLGDFVLPRNGQILRVHLRNFDERKWQRTGEDLELAVSKFDWNSMKFIDSKQSHKVLGSRTNDGRWPDPLGPQKDEDGFETEWIWLDGDTKSDGTEIINRELDPVQWRAWSIWDDLATQSAEIDHSARMLRRRTQAQTIFKASFAVMETGKNQVANRSAKVSFPVNRWTSFPQVTKPLAKSNLGLMYVPGTGEGAKIKSLFGPRAFDFLFGVWLFDRETFELIPVQIQNGPEDFRGLGWWRTVENASGDLLFEYKSKDRQRVALWVLDPQARQLRKLFEETAPEEYRSRVGMPLVDYDQMTLVGWTLRDSFTLRDSLLLPVKTNLERQ